MPELPEVETVKTALARELPPATEIVKVWASPYNLRFPYPKQFKKKLNKQTILRIFRRAKYLIFELEEVLLISHLGMSGTWREGKHSKKHDHFEMSFSNGKTFVYNDPRRFGFIEMVTKNNWQKTKLFSHLGPEPLDQKSFTSEYLFEKSRKKQVSIKNFLMDQKIVVGVGNIYANEALFLAHVRPQRPAGKITKNEADLLVKHIQIVLKKAIKAGGSYIRDFQNVEGASTFQRQLFVYGKEKQACSICETKIKKMVIGGRSTFYCSKCQK